MLMIKVFALFGLEFGNGTNTGGFLRAVGVE